MTDARKAKVTTFPSPQLNEQAVRKIGAKLREQFEDVATEPVPDRFAALLEELDQASAGGKGADHSHNDGEQN